MGGAVRAEGVEGGVGGMVRASAREGTVHVWESVAGLCESVAGAVTWGGGRGGRGGASARRQRTASSASTMGRWPPLAASSSAVKPKGQRSLTLAALAPPASSSATAPSCPASAAQQMAGRMPYTPWICALDLSSRRMQSRWPPFEALRVGGGVVPG